MAVLAVTQLYFVSTDRARPGRFEPTYPLLRSPGVFSVTAVTRARSCFRNGPAAMSGQPIQPQPAPTGVTGLALRGGAL